MMESFVQRIPLSKELDVDFGRLFPTEVEGFIVIMTSKESEFKSKFQFLLIAPECVNTEELKELIGDVMVAFFDTGDKYTVKKITDIEIENCRENRYKTPIISFDPTTINNDTINFFWLIPPRYLWQ